ncbi:ComF family protein [Rhizobiaceae bacterium BDR2-2]|uniref:ComF family protein n=1 Tax=Ectorhizobium quercum TaxID=2965071 RepID=A0AAE3N648_9HYPH|nr:ComF family protein [Ectorhizobium quercum]MCX8999975.1 ComF family protein [Ectorhizobium quercum]
MTDESLAFPSEPSPLAAAFRRWAAFVVDLVYPPHCAGCGTASQRHRALCPSCWSSVRFIEKPYCAVLGIPFRRDEGEGMLSPAAIARPPVFDRLRAVALHEGVARHLVHRLKYRDRTDLAPMMAEWMIRASDGYVAACDAVVPVPLHARRMLSRRFNQSAELARPLARKAGKPLLAHALVRVKPTRRQVGLSARRRAANVRGAFRVRKGQLVAIRGKHILLVDDVYTTGATVSAAARALKRAGAAEVTVLTFAMALGGPI